MAFKTAVNHICPYMLTVWISSCCWKLIKLCHGMNLNYKAAVIKHFWQLIFLTIIMCNTAFDKKCILKNDGNWAVLTISDCVKFIQFWSWLGLIPKDTENIHASLSTRRPYNEQRSHCRAQIYSTFSTIPPINNYVVLKTRGKNTQRPIGY